MIRHTVLFKWTAETTAEQKQRVVTELHRLPGLVPTLRRFDMGADLGVNDNSFDFAVAAEFDDLDGYLAYRDNPEHRAIITEHIAPITSVRAAVQYEVG